MLVVEVPIPLAAADIPKAPVAEATRPPVAAADRVRLNAR